MKVCTTCGVEKALVDFHRSKTGRYGRQPKCKVCCAEYQLAHKIRKLEIRYVPLKERVLTEIECREREGR